MVGLKVAQARVEIMTPRLGRRPPTRYDDYLLGSQISDSQDLVKHLS